MTGTPPEDVGTAAAPLPVATPQPVRASAHASRTFDARRILGLPDESETDTDA